MSQNTQLILLRHGESMWNSKNLFTGWVDVPLSLKGIEEAVSAGKVLSGIDVALVYTSTLVRAMQTVLIALAHNKSQRTPVVVHQGEGKMSEWSTIYNSHVERECIPVYQDWRLNERYYGKLQGNNKQETAREYGEEQVKIWRRSYDVQPPSGESLKDTAQRTLPFFQDKIMAYLAVGKTVLISAHGNSLRSIVMHLDKLSEKEVLELEIPTGKPIIYRYQSGQFEKENSPVG